MSSRNIVYIREFDKFDDNGDIICRNTGCDNLIKSPFRKYCSKECNKQFEKWYYHNFYWDRVRSDIFKRDNYTCQNSCIVMIIYELFVKSVIKG